MSRDIRGKHTHRQLHVRCVSRAREGGELMILLYRERRDEREEGGGQGTTTSFRKEKSSGNRVNLFLFFFLSSTSYFIRLKRNGIFERVTASIIYY